MHNSTRHQPSWPFGQGTGTAWATALLALVLAPGCANIPTIADLMPFGSRDPEPQRRSAPTSVSEVNNQMAGWSSPGAGGAAPVLYGRDGAPVGQSRVSEARPGQITRTRDPINGGVGNPDDNRPVLLELYTESKQELDALTIENGDLSARWEASETTLSDLRQRVSTLEAQNSTLTQDNGKLEERLFDLAGRLAQAQISRLEAERALIEASIEWRRMNASNTRSAGDEQ